MKKLKPKDKYELGELVRVPKIRGTITMLTCYGWIEAMIPTNKGRIIAYIRLTYGSNYIGYLPFYTDELNQYIYKPRENR